jgi:hypothetical protein
MYLQAPLLPLAKVSLTPFIIIFFFFFPNFLYVFFFKSKTKQVAANARPFGFRSLINNKNHESIMCHFHPWYRSVLGGVSGFKTYIPVMGQGSVRQTGRRERPNQISAFYRSLNEYKLFSCAKLFVPKWGDMCRVSG